MRRVPALLCTTLFAVSAAAAQAGGARWSASDIVQAYGQPISAVRTPDGGVVMSYDNLTTRQFVSGSTYRRYPQNLWKHATVSLQFAVDASMQCRKFAVVFSDSVLDDKVTGNAAGAQGQIAGLRADVNAALAGTVGSRCS